MEDLPLNQIVMQRRERLRERLAGVDLMQLASRAGLSHSTLWRIREGKSMPDPDTVDAIEAALRRFGDAVEAP